MSRKRTTVFVNSLRDLDLSEIKMPMAVIYDSPKDFPDIFVQNLGGSRMPSNNSSNAEKFTR